MEDAEWNLLDPQILGLIWLDLTKNVAHNVAEEETTINMMNTLYDIYEKPFVNKEIHLMEKLFNLEMWEDTSTTVHVIDLNTIIS